MLAYMSIMALYMRLCIRKLCQRGSWATNWDGLMHHHLRVLHYKMAASDILGVISMISRQSAYKAVASITEQPWEGSAYLLG